MRIHFRSGPIRKKPQAGDEKIIQGVVHIRQQQRSREGWWLVANGRPVWEWVVKGSKHDRSATK